MAGTPHEARWVLHEPRRSLHRSQLDRAIRTAFGSRDVSRVLPLTDGLRNSNFKIELAEPFAQVVLRFYEHDPILCRKEMDLIRLIDGRVPVPEIIHAEPCGLDGDPPFVLMTFVEGMSLRDFRQTAGKETLAEVGYSLGQTVAAIGQFSFGKAGWISAGPHVTVPLLEGADPFPRFVEVCLGSSKCQERVPKAVSDRVRTLLWHWAPQLTRLESERQLVHGDLSHRNILVRLIKGRWQVTAILDWEFAIATSVLADVGHVLLRHERRSMDIIEPHFVLGYLDHGGQLPENWRSLAGLMDLTALCESLTHEQLPDAIVQELVEIIRNTADSIESNA